MEDTKRSGGPEKQPTADEENVKVMSLREIKSSKNLRDTSGPPANPRTNS